MVPATDEDFDTEYLSLDIAAAVVPDLDAAIEHIAAHGTGHTEAIVTSSLAAADEFVARVDAAAVMVNASTAFTDGGEFGFGAEIGISTQKLHARGPMGLAELTSTKYVVTGTARSGRPRDGWVAVASRALVTGDGCRCCVDRAAVADLARSARRGRRIGVMGGTFDPIHHGHLVAASEVADQFGLDEVIFVPTGHPWQKSGESAAEHRYLMTVIATAANPSFTVSRVDIDRPGPTYTKDTLTDLRAAEPDAEWFFITGADALAAIMSWKDVDELFALAHFIGVTRPGYTLHDLQLPDGSVTFDRGAGAGDLVDRLPVAGPQRRAGLVPGAGRGRPVHRQTRSVPGES